MEIYLIAAALLISVVNSACMVIDWKSVKKTKKAMLDYIRSESGNAYDGAVEYADEVHKAVLDSINDSKKETLEECRDICKESAKNLEQSISDLKDTVSGLSLDYSQARAAAKHINDYATGLMNIFDYDPMDMARNRRAEGGGN